MTIENERTLKDLTTNLETITGQLEEFTNAESLPPRFLSRIEKLKRCALILSSVSHCDEISQRDQRYC